MSYEAQRDAAGAPRTAETAPLEYRQAEGNEITNQGFRNHRNRNRRVNTGDP